MKLGMRPMKMKRIDSVVAEPVAVPKIFEKLLPKFEESPVAAASTCLRVRQHTVPISTRVTALFSTVTSLSPAFRRLPRVVPQFIEPHRGIN